MADGTEFPFEIEGREPTNNELLWILKQEYRNRKKLEARIEAMEDERRKIMWGLLISLGGAVTGLAGMLWATK